MSDDATARPVFPETVDVLVVGGGPAGAAAATVLARAGLAVTVVDKARFPRDKCCGDGLTTGALRRLESLGFDPATVPSWTWVDDFVLSTPRRHAIRFPLPKDGGHFAAVAPRVELDHALLQLAAAAGARVVEGCSLVAVRDVPGGVRAQLVHDDGGTTHVEAAHLVAADGMWSTTRKLLAARAGTPVPPADEATEEPVAHEAGRRRFRRADTYLGEWHGYRQYARNVHTEASRDFWIWFEPDLVPGYLWSFPLTHGRVNLGFGIERSDDRPTKEMKSLWPDLLARPHVRAVLGPHVELEAAPKAWPIPADVTGTKLSIGRVLFVGDAARACDVLTGEGIGQALQTGIAAAESIVEARTSRLAHEQDAGPFYAERVRSELGPDHRMAGALTTLMSTRLVAESAIRISGANGWTRRNFARWLFEDYPRGIALTPTRWRWGLMSGPGAYPRTPR